MTNANVKLKTIQAAMRAAATRGVDPRNSHEVQAQMLQRHWKMESGRRRAVEEEERLRQEQATARGGRHGQHFLSVPANAQRFTLYRLVLGEIAEL